ncbi:hypothetical protein BBJ28_00017546, partial [Nothophytophthora sp. Chile5]
GQGFMGFSSAADDSDIVDPFEEAGLSFEQMPLAEALAAWDTSTEPVEETKQEVGEEGAADGVEGEEKEAKQVIDAQRDGLLLTSENGEGTPEVSRPTDATIMDALDATHDADDDVAVTSEYEDVELLENPLTIERRTMELPAPDSPLTAAAASIELTATEEPSPAEYTQFLFISDQTKSEPKSQALSPKDTDVHSLGLQDAAFESDESGSGEGSVRSASENEIAWPEEQEAMEEEASPFERNHSGFMSFSSPAMADENRRVEGAGQTLVSEDETSLDREASGNGGSEVVKEESNGPSEEDQAADSDEDEGFGDFGGFEAVASSTSSASAPTGFGLDSESRAPQPETFDAFGDFAAAAPTTLASGVVVKAVEDDDFGDFAQSSSTADAMGDDDFGGFAQSTDVNDDFGDFAQSSSTQDEGGFSDFQQSSSSAFDNDDDGFGDFTPSVPVAPVPPMVPAASKEELSAFFHQAFTTDPVPPSPPSLTMDSIDYKASDVVQEPSTPFVQDVFRSTWDEYLSLVSTTSGRASSSSSASVSSPVAQDPNDSSERTLECRKTARASKYLKYVLSEKIQEASRQNGIFPHGSDRHQTYVELAASGDAERMRTALKELQDALFLNSVNDAMMRIAKQAALSAKAKIAEQAAQQQASSRGGSLFSTTRHLLSRGGGTGGGGHGPGSSGNESKGEHTGADTPTGASVQKLSRFSFAGHDDSGNGHHGPSGGEEIGSEGSDHTGHSSGSDTDVLAGSGAGDSRTRSSSLTNSGGASGNGGLMKKFQDRFSFASSRHRPRFVSLRRKGQSGEEVRKMELNLDAISGGLDEVKWKCAMFLYDVEEVAHVAPSQIRILAYPSKQLLAGKTDRSALVKLVKPGTIWTVDIGANNSDLLNECHATKRVPTTAVHCSFRLWAHSTPDGLKMSSDTITSGAATPQDSYDAVESPTSEHAIHLDVGPKQKSMSIFQKNGAASDAYENTLYEHDLVLVFPRREGGEAKKPEDFTMPSFVQVLMGKDAKRSQRRDKIVIDPFQRVLRTQRCFLDDHGNEAVADSSHDHSEVGEQKRLETDQKLLEAEYQAFVGSADATTELRFCELVATAISRRVQLACGLTTRMFLSCDGDEIILTVTPDNDDLRVEADRTNYRLQLSNKPFDSMLHRDKIRDLKREIGDDHWLKSVELLRVKRGTANETSEVPEMDPLLVSRGPEFHPELRKALDSWGHREEADGMFADDDTSQSVWNGLWASISSLPHDSMTYFAPFADYRHEPQFQSYYRRYPTNWGGKKEQTLFTQKDRIRLAAGIVDRHLNLDALQEAGYLKGNMFALHDKVAREDLRQSWALNWRMICQPLHKIRYYFGEKIALYFAWLEFYTKMLLFPAIAGIVTFACVEARDAGNAGKKQSYILIAFAIFVVLWSSLFSEIWKRKNGLLGALWGLHGFEEVSHYRPQFRGTKSYDPITDVEEMTYESRAKRHRWFVVSVIVMTVMVGIVLVALFGLFVLKYWINNTDNLQKKNIDTKYQESLTLSVTVGNAIQIIVLNMIYRRVAKQLNDLENHRTDGEYENYLAIKVFLFQFCNSFASFFYIAFIKRTAEGSCLYEDDCMKELRDQLLVLFLVRIVVGNTMEVVIPYLKYRYQLYSEQQTNGVQKSSYNFVEDQAKLIPYESNEAFEDYNEMAIQFGFHNLFVVAFPLTPLLALANNLVEVHVDAVKLCFGHRRPFPDPAKSIGVWFYILRAITYISVGTNTALILWTSDLFEDTSATVKAFVFVVACQVCLALALFIERSVPDTPHTLALLLQRYDHIENVVFKGLSEGDTSHLNEVSESLDLNIYPNDQWESGDIGGGHEQQEEEVRAAAYPQSS